MNQPSITGSPQLPKGPEPAKFKKTPLMTRIWKERWLYLFLMPGVIYFIIYKYLPMWGVLLAFKDYKPYRGFFGSEWVGLKHFERFFSEPEFWQLLRNTLYIATLDLVIFFPFTIVLALLLNEVRKEVFKRTIQTFVYVPHFLS